MYLPTLSGFSVGAAALHVRSSGILFVVFGRPKTRFAIVAHDDSEAMCPAITLRIQNNLSRPSVMSVGFVGSWWCWLVAELLEGCLELLS